MLCEALITIVRDVDLLAKGAARECFNVRPGCTLSTLALCIMRHGKDEAIDHMLTGGNGFPETSFRDPIKQAQYDLGVTSERRDLRANHVWATDLVQALADRKRGRCNG